MSQTVCTWQVPTSENGMSMDVYICVKKKNYIKILRSMAIWLIGWVSLCQTSHQQLSRSYGAWTQYWVRVWRQGHDIEPHTVDWRSQGSNSGPLDTRRVDYISTKHSDYILSTYTSWVSFVTIDHSILPKYMLSQWDGSFEHPKQILKRMDKKIFTFNITLKAILRI